MQQAILFLDIDGVMNTTTSALRHRSGRVFTREAVESLRRILRHSCCDIVISSTRRCDGVDAMRDLFASNGLAEAARRIAGLTPCIGSPDSDDWREDEIAAWLDVKGLPANLAILDDKPFCGPLRRFLVQTHCDHGLMLCHTRMILALLGS